MLLTFFFSARRRRKEFVDDVDDFAGGQNRTFCDVIKVWLLIEKQDSVLTFNFLLKTLYLLVEFFYVLLSSWHFQFPHLTAVSQLLSLFVQGCHMNA